MDPPKITLCFSKKKEPSLLRPSILLDSQNVTLEDNIKETISTFDNGTKWAKPIEKELVIPLLGNKRENAFHMQMKETFLADQNTDEHVESLDCKVLEESKSMTLDERAAMELIKEGLDFKNEDSKIYEKKIELDYSMQNDKDEMSGDADISSLDDYDKVGIHAYGAALLRGMGWKKDQGIGKNTFKRVVQIIDPTAGQIIGQIVKKKMKGTNATTKDYDQEMLLTKNCHVLIHSGRNKGTYGIVESLDCDHLLVQPALGGATIREVEANVEVVTKDEYKDSSRVINKDMYEKFKGNERAKKEVKPIILSTNVNETLNKKGQSDRGEIVDCKMTVKNIEEKKFNDNPDNAAKDDKNISKINYKQKYDKHSCKPKDSLNGKMYKKYDNKSFKQRKHSKDIGKPYLNDIDYDLRHHKESQLSIPVIPWVRENLRIRLINKTYKGGKYHKEKMKVESIETVYSCTCITDDGKMLYDLDPNWFETVIPKGENAKVLIVKGDDKGQKARILQLHKDKEKATIQLLHDSSVLLKLHYEDICEYVT